ncbi:MAG: selenium metabolism-associated LysR family transcriptional regulator [Minisyncoccia bacterium]
MNLREIKIFLTVCECGSMSDAARKLYMTQPSISQTISELEEELNVKLFERISKKLFLTYPGKILQEHGKKIIMLLNEVQNNILDIANMNTGRLRIGASTTIGIYLLPDLIGEFNKEYKNIELDFTIDNTGIIEKILLENIVDIGIVEGPVHSKDIVVKPYIYDELYLICSKEHKWAREKSIKPEAIEEENLIIREQGSGTREVFDNTMFKHNYKYNIKHVLNNTEAIKKAVEANIGVSCISKIAIKEELKSGKLMKIDVAGIEFKRELNIIYHKDKYHTKLFDEFINYLLNNTNI